jgi:small subunit ribosomal protein S3
MGQKVHPLILRIGFIKNWSSSWFAPKKEYADLIQEDIKIRKLLKSKLSQAAVSRIDIERLSGKVRIKIYTARPGIVIGRRGADIERLKSDLQQVVNKEFIIDIVEVKDPSKDAQLISENIAFQLEKRIAFRRAMKRAVEQAMNAGAQGIKIEASGRLGGAEMSRKESYKEGKLPRQTLRSDIDYGFTQSLTTYGIIGIKVWVYHGEILPEKKQKAAPVIPQQV